MDRPRQTGSTINAADEHLTAFSGVASRIGSVGARSGVIPAARGSGAGRALTSKDLIERLEPDDATALDLDPDHITYIALGDLATATEKARRDAPAIAVCEV